MKLKDLPASLITRNETALAHAGLLCRAELRRLPDGRVQAKLWITTRSRANARGTRSERIVSNATQRDQTKYGLARLLGAPPEGPVVVVMTRFGPGVVDDHDNLPTALKGPADGVAAWLGRDDADPSIGWCYRQAVDPVWSVLFEVRRVVRRPRVVAAALDVVDAVGARGVGPGQTEDGEELELAGRTRIFLAGAFR